MACARTPREHKHNHEAGHGPCSHAASTNTTRGTMWPLCVRAHINTLGRSENSTAGTVPAHRAPVQVRPRATVPHMRRMRQMPDDRSV